ncbi:MAG TPA: (2Fe-2S)-binding protein [Candidatus Caldiarchaeum subterraneum]|uniref:(2Fe-2S)-binding protein n=1 Tax=Caldiarchaeum subterraneum TaxID=311458 RepID=A0A832ZVZ6_CALS0|nr:(2Fe-2S)-binding protein [Aigarchaeota archaeon]HIQ29728.1 (2Fe-2S)-binding protein [Candidatus Caldarchaeum subterraneum]
MRRRVVRFILNGEEVEVYVPPAFTLLEVLRDVLHLTGTKDGCSDGDCGACTVLLDGKAVHSCLTIMAQVEGREVTTVEGLAGDGEPDVVQKAYVETGAIQCGYCIPGFIMATKALLTANPSPSEDDILEALRGNLCRCTGYVKIVEAVKKAVEEAGR